MRKKISIIGAGFVGSTAAHWIAAKELGDVVLLDVVEGIPQGKALDLFQAMPLEGSDVNITGTNDYKDIAGSDVVVVTAGVARKSGMTREDLIAINAKIIKGVSENIKKYAPKSVVIVVSNPMDAMVYLTWKITGFPKQRVVGMAGVLDSARFRTFIAEKSGYSVKDVSALVIGGHGDTMVPLHDHATIGGIPLKHFFSHDEILQMVERTRNAGAEIVNYLKTGSAYFAPGKAISDMVESIVRDQKRILPCSALCEGEYGAKHIFIGVPVVLGTKGVEEIVELDLSSEESEGMKKTIVYVYSLVESLKKIS